MLIIEIHVDTIEESNSSTSKTVDESSLRSSPKRATQKKNNEGSRFWNTIRFSFPGSLIQKENHKDER